ncbi:hypothetical protein [Nostoc sp.]|uniref:hypothetical protein n=1 Tax=Nostoc sp. TaxID=1180 RepID=UPI002FFD3EEB
MPIKINQLPKEEENFKEPEFENLNQFITYCNIYDPNILLDSGGVFARDSGVIPDKNDRLILHKISLRNPNIEYCYFWSITRFERLSSSQSQTGNAVLEAPPPLLASEPQ